MKWNLEKLTPILVAAAALCSTQSLRASFVQSITPSADALVSAANPTNNYGGAGALAISASSLSKGEFQSVLMFDLSAAKTAFDANLGGPGNWQVTSIALKMTATPPSNSLFNGFGAGPSGSNINFAGAVNASWMANDSWTEGSGTPSAPTTTGITFSTLSSFLSGGDQSLGSFSFSGNTSGLENYTLLAPSGLLGDISSGSLASIRLSAGDSQVSALYNSRSFGTASARPTLVITADSVPEPGTLLVLTGGLLAMCRMDRNRKKVR